MLSVTAHAPQAIAATFELDPLESRLSLSGYHPAGPFYPDRPFYAQGNDYLTTPLNGTLQISQWTADALRIDDSWIIPKLQPRPASPGKMPAVFAGYLNGVGTFLVEQSYAPLWGILSSAGAPGTYQVGQTQLGFGTRAFIGQQVGDPWWYTDSFGRVLNNIAAGNATLTQADGRYRIDIPFASTEQDAMQDEIVIRFTGRLVAYSDVPPTSAPSIADGRFELGHSWAAGNDSSGVVFNPSVTKHTWTLDQQEWGNAGLRPKDSTEYFYQQIAGEGMLSAATLYEVVFDIINDTKRYSAPAGEAPDDATSVEVYLSLGDVERSGAYEAAGGIYRLEHLSQIPLGQWQRGNSFVLDTSFLTPEQLQQEVFLVFRATSSDGQSTVNFDNVRLSVVPETSTLALGASGALVLALLTLHRERQGPRRFGRTVCAGTR